MQKRFAILLFIGLFAGLFALTADVPANAATTLPTKMNFQGRVTNASGSILPNGTYNMKFRIWSASTAGTQLWSEDRLVSAGQGVTVTNGQFSVQLGSVTSLPASVFASNSLYFEVELPTPASATTSSPVWTEGAMTPRNQLATSAYAYNSETLDGLDSAAFGQLDQNNVFTGNNTFNGTIQGGSSLTLGTSSAQGSLVLNDGNGQTGTLRMADIAGNYTYSIPVTTANDTFCLQSLANCSSSVTVGSLDGTTASANGASIVGSTLYLQSASTSNAGLVNTTTQSFAGNKTFTGSVTVSGTTSLNDNVTVAAGKTIQYVGSTTSNRPASPAEGMVYYDTDTKKLEIYSNGKWQADRTDAVLVAASNSSQADKDAADYVADGNSGAAGDGDQVQVNMALAASAGKKIVLLAGTYTVDDSISIPNGTMLAGVGKSTVVETGYDNPLGITTIVNTDNVNGEGIQLRDLVLNGRKDIYSSGYHTGVYFSHVGSSSGNPLVISGVEAKNFSGDGFAFGYVSNAKISQNSASGNTYDGFVFSDTTFTTFDGNTAIGNDIGIDATHNNSKNTLSNNIMNNNRFGLYLTGEATINGNIINNSSEFGISSFQANFSSITSNIITNNASGGINLGASAYNTVMGNNLKDNGGSANNDAITLTNNAQHNIISNNTITDFSWSTTNYAISISASAPNNKLSNNNLNTGTINDLSTGTEYGGQVDGAGNYVIQPAANINLNKNTIVSSGSLTLGSSSTAGALIISDGSSNTATIVMAPTSNNTTYTLPVTGGSDTFCLLTAGNCTLAIDTYSTTNTNANGATISGNSITFQNASATAPGMVGIGSQTFGGNKTFNGSVTLNNTVTVAADMTIRFVGGLTSNRPASPGEGTVYYDTDTKKLQVFSNGKWQADRTDAILVAASNSSQADKDAADYVGDGDNVTGAGTIDGDQVQINNALTAAAGKQVVLLAGTYVADATILIPNNTTLSGVGRGTLIELADIDATDNLIESSDASTGTGVTIKDLRIDGRSDLNTAGTQYGIYLSNMGSGSGGTARQGAKISGAIINSFRTNGIVLSNSSNATVTGNTFQANSTGLSLFSGSQYNTISGNLFQGGTSGLSIGAAYNSITGNTIQGVVSGSAIGLSGSNNSLVGNTIQSCGYGINITAGNSVINGNSITGCTSYALFFQNSGASDNTVSSNRLHDNGTATSNNAIYVTSADNNSFTNNSISDTSATVSNYAININNNASDVNYLSNNTLGGGNILDNGTGTIYVSQVDASGNMITRNQGGTSIGKTTVGTTLDIQGAIQNVALPTPTAPTLGTTGTAGTMTYGYRVAALDGLGETLASTETTITTGNATLSGTNYINITWPMVGGAVQYKIYRSTSAGTPSSTGLIRTVAGNVQTTTDTGIAASGAVAASNTTGGASFGGAMQGGSSLTLGTASVQGSLVLNDGNGQTGTIRMADIAGNYTYTIPVTTANDTFCLQTLANCAATLTVGAYSTGNTNANGATITGSSIIFQDASATAPGMVGTGTQTFAGNKTFNGTVTLNDTVTVAANKTIQFVGGATASRPASPGEGALFYDTDTKKLEIYSNGKWQADRTDVVLVAASNSSQADKDAADFVADGNTVAASDGDQIQIQSALTAGAGKKVVLLAGTYTADATILVPNNTTLSGVGRGTIIEFGDIDVTDNLIENTDASTGTGVTIQDMQIDGRKDLNTAGTQNGIYLYQMGSGTGASARQGGTVRGVLAKNFSQYGIQISTSSNNVLTGNTALANNSNGIFLHSGSNNVASNNNAQGNATGIALSIQSNSTVSGNSVQGNTSQGISIFTSDHNMVTGNILEGNPTGFYVSSAANNNLTGNTVRTSTANAFALSLNANYNIISGNRISDSGGATANNAISVANSDYVSVTGNSITDSSATTTNYAITVAISTSDATYLADNSLGTGSINDLGTGTIYASQVDASGNLTIQPAANINLNKNTVISSGSLTLGNSTTAGGLAISDGSSNTATIAVAPTAGNYTYTIPVTTANDTFCLVTLSNCAAAGSGVTTVGALEGGTANANGATIVGTTVYLQSASASFAGLVNTTTQTFAGDKTFNGVLTVANAANFSGQLTIGTADTTGVLLVLDTKTDAGDPVGVNGAMYYNSSLKRFRCFQDSAWVDCSTGEGMYKKIADQAATANSTTFQNIADMSFAVGANETYSFDAIIPVNMSDTTADLKYTVIVPAGATITAQGAMPTTATALTSCAIQTSAQSCAISITAAYRGALSIRGIVTNGATAGTLNIQFAQSAVSATAAPTVLKGATIRYDKL